MTVGDILVSINQASLDTMLPLTAVQTSADIERYYKEGYSIGITATEFAKKYPRLPVGKIYAAHNMLAPLYYCEFDSTTVPIVLSLNIYGDKRLAVNSESDEKFQQRVLGAAENISTGNAPFIRSYLFSLEDSLRVSVLSRYIELSNPDEDLYSLFLDLYRTSDFGFSALEEDDLQKVFAGKSQKQKQDTIKRLSSLPDTVTVYRGKGVSQLHTRNLSPGPQATRQPVSLPAASRVSRTAESSLPMSANVTSSSIFRMMKKKRSLSHRLP